MIGSIAAALLAVVSPAQRATGQGVGQTEGWFPFEPVQTSDAGVLGMRGWMSIGSERVEARGDSLFEGDRQVRFWGTNVEYNGNKPPANKARRTAAWFASYGVNFVRMHKLANPGWQGLGSEISGSVYEPADLERFDFFCHQLREHGVRYAFSPIWELQVFEGDRQKLLAYDELVAHADGKPTTRGLVWFAPDVQDLHIEALVNLVGHRNASSGLRYADDPALVYVEIQNEENAFWFSVMADVVRYPTYKKLVAAKFSAWLIDRYGTERALKKAWGSGWRGFARDGAYRDESLAAKTVFPVCSPWFLDAQSRSGGRATRLQDTARFLFECQNRYYERAVSALRGIGYGGLVVGSNWQAGQGAGHFLNLASDAELSIVDRHNYLEGAVGGYQVDKGSEYRNATSLDHPGSGLLSTGMQQVAGKPFMLSEWLATVPHEWAAAETAIIALYGMGLQGWDLSAFFASNHDGFTPTVNFPGKKRFNNQTAHGIGMFPVLSRAVLRGDIFEGPVVADRRLSLKQAIRGDYDFEHGTHQVGDIKSFTGTPGEDALAVGRVVVGFGEGDQRSRFRTLDDYRKDGIWTSATGQLMWRAPGDARSGSIVVDSPGTQGVIGFAGGARHKLGQITVSPQSPYSVLLMTAREQDATLVNCKEALILAVARVRNRGMQLGEDKVLALGGAPQVVEPVVAEFDFRRRPKEVRAVDVGGRLKSSRLRLEGKKLVLNTGHHQAIYYLVRW